MERKDWSGSRLSLIHMNGASNHCSTERQNEDYYSTPPYIVEMLCDLERFDNLILEPACGEGHISKVLESRGYTVESHDLIDRGYGTTRDFLSLEQQSFDGDIVTNPPYKYALEFVEKSLAIIEEGHKVAMFLKLTFLEGKKRRSLFDTGQLKTVYVSTTRVGCGINGKEVKESAVAYAWFIWEKGYKGDPVIRWFN